MSSGGLDFKANAIICGGYGDGTYYQDCFTFGCSQWTSAPSFEIGKEFSTMVAPPLCDHSANGIISTGGNRNSKLDTMEVLKEGTGKWKSNQLPRMPDPLWTHCTVYINSTMFMVIGGSTSDSDASDKTYYFNSEKQTWTEGPKLLHGRNSHSCGRIKTNNEASGMVKHPSGYSDTMLGSKRVFLTACFQ